MLENKKIVSAKATNNNRIRDIIKPTVAIRTIASQQSMHARAHTYIIKKHFELHN